MRVEVLTPRKIEFQEEAEFIVLPTLSGEIAVFPRHASLISVLKPGKIKIKTKEKETSFEIEGGILEMVDNKATILLKRF